MTSMESILGGIVLLFVGATANRLWNGRRIERLETNIALLTQNQTNLQNEIRQVTELFKGHIETHGQITEAINKILSQSSALITAMIADRKVGR